MRFLYEPSLLCMWIPGKSVSVKKMRNEGRRISTKLKAYHVRLMLA